jgi:hypothetical protein
MDLVCRCGHSPYRYGHPGYRYGIRANDMGDDSINMVILDIDMGYLVTLQTVKGPSESGPGTSTRRVGTTSTVE